MKAHHSCRNRNTELAIFSSSTMNWTKKIYLWAFCRKFVKEQALSREKMLSSKLKHIQFYFFVVAQIKLILSSHILLLRLKKRKPTKAVPHFDLLGGEENFSTIICWCGQRQKVYGLLSTYFRHQIFRRLFLRHFPPANKNLGQSFSTLWHTLTFFFHIRAQWFKKIFTFHPLSLNVCRCCYCRVYSAEFST